jgi:Tol biopolymer transport system component
MRLSRGFATLLVGVAGWLVWSPPAAAQSGALVLASTSDTGIKGNRDSAFEVISADGTKVAFRSNATNLDPADTDGIFDIYVKDLVTGDITLASTSDQGIKGNGPSGLPILSTDGTRVGFTSIANNLDPRDRLPLPDPEGSPLYFPDDAYVKDLVSGDLILASASATGKKANYVSFLGALSSNGRKAVVNSRATNLSPRDLDTNYDIYFKDLTTGTVRLVSTSDTGEKQNDGSAGWSFAAGKIEFETGATNLDPADQQAFFSDVYVKDVVTGEVTFISTSYVPGGDGYAFAGGLSADGNFALFTTLAANVDPIDTDHYGDVWVRNLTTGTLTLVSASADGIKSNRSSGSSQGGSISADGSRVVFASKATNLDPSDKDTFTDIYVKTIA